MKIRILFVLKKTIQIKNMNVLLDVELHLIKLEKNFQQEFL